MPDEKDKSEVRRQDLKRMLDAKVPKGGARRERLRRHVIRKLRSAGRLSMEWKTFQFRVTHIGGEEVAPTDERDATERPGD